MVSLSVEAKGIRARCGTCVLYQHQQTRANSTTKTNLPSDNICRTPVGHQHSSSSPSTYLSQTENKPDESLFCNTNLSTQYNPNTSQRRFTMCKYYVHNHRCGHAEPVFAAYCTAGQLSQRRCEGRDKVIWTVVKMETECVGCGADAEPCMPRYGRPAIKGIHGR